MTLQDAYEKLTDYYDMISIDDDTIIVEEHWEGDCKNDDDCCDFAREIGEDILRELPYLEVTEYYCHRHKYAIVNLRLK